MLYEPERFQRMSDERGDRRDICVVCAPRLLGIDGKILPLSREPAAARLPKDLNYRLQRLGQFWRELRTGVKEERPFRPRIGMPGYVNIAQGYADVMVRPEFF